MTRTLRSATEADAAAEAARAGKSLTVKQAADVGERALLVALRSSMATQLDAGVPSHALAALVKQLREVDQQIRAFDARAAEEAQDAGQATADAAFDASAV